MSSEETGDFNYWGYFINSDKSASLRFDQLCRGLAAIIRGLEPSQTQQLKPSQLAEFYKLVGGDLDALFLGTSNSGLSFLYRTLGCSHILEPTEDPFKTPSVPALTDAGFTKWVSVQLLLSPEEHVPYLQQAVSLWDIPHPDGGTFPKVLPSQCLPDKPDPEMERWYYTVTAQLKSTNTTSRVRGRGRTHSSDQRHSYGRSRSDEDRPVLSTDPPGNVRRKQSTSTTSDDTVELPSNAAADIEAHNNDSDSGFYSISRWAEHLRSSSIPYRDRRLPERLEGSVIDELAPWTPQNTIGRNHYTHKFVIQWEGKEYICQQFEPSQPIKDVMVLWQDTDVVKLTDCAHYIGLRNPRIFDAITSVLQGLHRAPEASFSRTVFEGDKSLTLNAKFLSIAPSVQDHALQIELSLETNWWLFKDIVQEMLRRLAGILRPADKALSWSEASTEETRSCTNIQLLPLQNAEILSCWCPLFSQKVIAKSAMSKVYSSSFILGLDLELEFADLIDLCGVIFPIDLDDGICLSGTYSLLIPIETRPAASHPEKALVWHLLTVDYSEAKPSKARRQLWSAWKQWCESQGDRWYRTQSIDELHCFKRHILGWTHSSTVTLGTDRQPYNLRRSQAPIESREQAETTFNLGMNLGYGGSGLSASRSVRLGRTELSRYHDRDKHIIDWLGESTEEQVLLYHPDKQQTWLLSKIAVLHHLALERMHYMLSRHNIGDSEELEPLYLTSEGTDPSTVFNLLVSALDTPFPHWAGRQYRLRDALNSILCMLDQFERSNLLRSTRRSFMGFEAYDTIHQTPFFRVKKANTSNHPLALRKLGGWVNILEDVPVILFYRGIYDPIVPIPQDGNHKCADCVRLPRGRNYLATTITSLFELGKKYSTDDFDCIQLASSAYWHYRKAWDDVYHEHETCIEERSQAIWTYQSYCDGPPREVLRKLTNAAVIFTPGMGIMST